ncbi:hypothetical protein CspeluHIS016_0900560 [Cutaneotrichosporon spelunceum]|uniref:BHLH domain-containing protein n=1 Tax=Cutaneotrichosporon spelunceum TaxID=1672016 RepID=A0AAD3U092_9TREE|nr:hypothetical protein CspeluHIS016_0900560 [Cutaneotrichosporon spelunceum]
MATITPPMGSPTTTKPLSIKMEAVGIAGLARPATAAPAVNKPKPRKRNNNAEKRELHNATERARRETLNGRFDTLRDQVPGLRGCRRASKSAVVNGAISSLKDSRRRSVLSAKVIRELAAERNELFEECNRLRQMAHLPPKAGPTNLWTDEMAQICTVEEEPVYIPEEAGDDLQIEDDSDEMDLQQANIVAGNIASGLITPPLTTDMGSEQSIWPSSFTAPAIPFSFMNNSTETSSSNSPVGSSHMITPPHIEGPSPSVALGVSPHTSSPASSPQQDEVWGQFGQSLFQQAQQVQQTTKDHAQAMLQMQTQFGGQQYDLSMFLTQGMPQNVSAVAFPQQREAIRAPSGGAFDLCSFMPEWLQQQQSVGV